MSEATEKIDYVSTGRQVTSKVTSHRPDADRVIILMAAYNGAQFIEQQIHSIQQQSFSEWALYVRDDGSSDDTVARVLQVVQADKRVKLIQDELGNQGAIGNFATLMELALNQNAKYVFFADQDDIWHSEKLSTMLLVMQDMEQTQGVNVPLLVHCDLTIVNDALMPVAESFMKFSRLSPATADLGVLLCQNQVTGCACMINHTLLELACPVPLAVGMHDWWLALIASAAGEIGYISKALVMYRQHSGNVLGAVSFYQRIKRLVLSPERWKKKSEAIKLSIIQAKLLAERIMSRGLKLPLSKTEQINTYVNILKVYFLIRPNKLRRKKIGMHVIIARWGFNVLITAINEKNKERTVA